ncbi:murein hydrolase activator EnvC family protein [Evansella cellulosilytica]|uniref:Peptidase M23 n=1 Tax=Evansella cellulosilytica (strain ATCC 21833 / DSM 2522 / FERM P-1141 / JCM 9156 / N-4) TaxID=649639 RepID=E6TRJ3_EVAC2|nr:M23 family metallopeptidase [Evansella cellulosilytica]ADU31823.1 Peptidase M23 [Evansella cellulosilytica DSM 2522]
MDRRLLYVSLAILLTFSTFLGTNLLTTAEANTGNELRDEINSYQEQQSDIEREAEEAEEELKQVQAEIDQAAADIRKLDEEMAITNSAIDSKQEEIDETNDRITDLVEEIEILEERIAQRDEILKDRARSMYQSGGSLSYIQVILGAQSFGDLIERVTALNTIAQQDRNILEQHVADKEAVEAAKLDLENELMNLEDQMSQLESLKAELKGQLAEKDEILDWLREEEISLEDQMVSLEEEQAILLAQEEAAKQELERWEEEQRRLEEERKRQEEEERKRKEEEERQRQLELERQQQQEQEQPSSPPPSQDNNSNTNNNASPPPDNSSSTLMRPATGTITSGYGHRWGRMHHGIDIGQGGRSNVPIVAAEAGTVTYAGWMNGYGNTILITHVIEGRTVTTLYAHLASFSISNGQRVSRGQQIGIMGNTGESTGPHLHFEVHEGGWNAAKSNSRNPMNYIN